MDIICGGSPCQDLILLPGHATVWTGRVPAFLWNRSVLQRRYEMQIFYVDDQASLFDPDGLSGTRSVHSAVGRRNTRTSELSWKKSLELKAIPYMFIDLTPGHGNLLGICEWEMHSPWHGESWMLNTGPAPLNAADVYSLSQILEVRPHPKYYLSKKACLGILHRARSVANRCRSSWKGLKGPGGPDPDEVPTNRDEGISHQSEG